MKLIFTLFLAVALTAVTLGEEIKLRPLSENVATLNFEEPDLSEVAYIGMRLFSLYKSLGGIIVTNAQDESQKKVGQEFIEIADMFGEVGIKLNLTVNKMTNEVIQQQSSILTGEYLEEMKRGKLLHNTYATPFVLADMDAAQSVYPLFKAFETIFSEKP